MRDLEEVKCTPLARQQAQKGNLTWFNDYLPSTTDDFCTCACPIDGGTLLHEAAAGARLSSASIIIEALLSNGCDVDRTDNHGNTFA